VSAAFSLPSPNNLLEEAAMSRILNRTAWVIFGTLALLLVAVLAGVVRAGPLDPPPGVTTTTSTQEQLVFQPVDCTGFPIVLAGPGSYRLAQNITLPASCVKTGILLGTGATLDLGGFTLTGVPGPGSLNGILASTDASIRNGTVTAWGGFGVNAADHSSIENLDLYGNTGGGISVAEESTVDSVNVHNNTGPGVIASARSVLRSSEIVLNGGDGVLGTGVYLLIDGNNITNNGASGIRLTSGGARVEANHVMQNAGRGIYISGDENTVVNNTFTRNGIEGILVLPGNGNLVDSNHAAGNGSNNIAIDNATGAPNIITRNWATIGGAGNYAIGTGNDAAPQTTAATATNPMANIAQ
jgi:hypothetical protein